MQAGRQWKLLKDETHLGKIRKEFCQNRLRHFAMRTFQVTELNNVDGWILAATAGAKCGFQAGTRRRKGIRAKRQNLTNDSGLSSRDKKEMHWLLLVH